MHPTNEEHLAAVRRLLDEVAADPGLSDSSRRAIEEAAKRLRRIERSGAARLPFLVGDNRASRELMNGLADLAPDLAAAVPPFDEMAEHHEPTAHELNKRLRVLLARAVHQLPDDTEGDAWRARLATHLRNRIDTDPAINRPKGPTDG
jgi:hypothetical protein